MQPNVDRNMEMESCLGRELHTQMERGAMSQCNVTCQRTQA